jgi:fibronectin-binding autotransporter adhesin
MSLPAPPARPEASNPQDPLAGTTNTAAVSGEAITTFTSGGTFSVNLAERLGATLTQPVGGSGNLTYSGPGRLTLAADSSYVGTTTISAGTLQVGTGGSTGSLGSGGITNDAVLAFRRSDAVVVANPITGSGSVVQEGSGSLTLNATNTYAGDTIISTGVLQVGAGGGTGSLGSGNVSNSAAPVFNRDNALAVANVISGTGSLTQAGSGTLTLSGANTYSGGTTIAAGTLLEFSDLAAQAQAFVEDTTVFAMINYTGAWDGGFFTSNGQTLADGSRFFVGSQQWEIDYAATSGGLNFTDDYVSGSFVTITAVPEPATLALAAAASLGLAALTRRGGARGPGFANPIRSRRYTDPEKLWPRVASFHNGSRSRCCVEDSS